MMVRDRASIWSVIQRIMKNLFLWLLIALFGCIATYIGLHYGSWIPPIICVAILLLLVYKDSVAQILKRISRIDIGGKIAITLDESINAVDSLLSDAQAIEQYAQKINDPALLKIAASMQLKIYTAKGKLTMEKENIMQPGIERGENANGKYIRWPNGTQECFKYFPNGLKKTDDCHFIYPAAFSETPPIIHFIGINQPRILYKDPSGFKIEIEDNIINGFEVHIKGRWK